MFVYYCFRVSARLRAAAASLHFSCCLVFAEQGLAAFMGMPFVFLLCLGRSPGFIQQIGALPYYR